MNIELEFGQAKLSALHVASRARTGRVLARDQYRGLKDRYRGDNEMLLPNGDLAQVVNGSLGS